MAVERVPNQALQRALEQAGWSRKELARRVNRRGRHRGLALYTDASRVRGWLNGQHPQPPVPELLCELFTEHFGYPLAAELLGLVSTTDDHSGVGLSYLPGLGDTVAVVAELGRNDVHRRDFLRGAAFVAAASVGPSRDWLLATLDATHSRGGRVGHAQVAAIRNAFAVFQEHDVMRGGGHARRALAEYVTGHVLPLLRDSDPDTDAGAALFGAASEQTYLLGWMAFDDGRQALAQRYLVQSLRLAEASGDPALGSHVLAGMADQARMLGHPREALQLATAGRHALSLADSPASLADLWALQARAHAAMGETRQAVRAVAESETAHARIEHSDEPEWARFIDTAYLAGEWANAFVDLKRPVESTRFARLSAADARRQNRARRGALSQAALARAALLPARLDLERAVHHAHRTVDLAASVRSSRCAEAVAGLRSQLSAFRTAAARGFVERAGRLAIAAT